MFSISTLWNNVIECIIVLFIIKTQRFSLKTECISMKSNLKFYFFFKRCNFWSKQHACETLRNMYQKSHVQANVHSTFEKALPTHNTLSFNYFHKTAQCYVTVARFLFISQFTHFKRYYIGDSFCDSLKSLSLTSSVVFN